MSDNAQKTYAAIGLMTGTSLDGIDAALIKTDGEGYVENVGCVSLPYDPDLTAEIREYFGAKEDADGKIAKLETQLTLANADAVRELLFETGLNARDIDIIGFHGQTISHAPEDRFTWQLGDGDLLAQETAINVVNDFRQADIKAGGQGAPFLSLYHRAKLSTELRPAAVLNIGGVANVTWIGETDSDDDILAFDTGPGNALLNDFMRKNAGADLDKDGKLAFEGSVHQDVLQDYMKDPYFTHKPPKSIDRNKWGLQPARHLSNPDGAATLAALTAFAVKKGQEHFPAPVKTWLVSGGGRKNPAIMKFLSTLLDAPVKPVEDIGWDGDMLEAEGFAWLAVRHLKGLPLSVPNTTGVPEPMPGGILHKAR